MSHGFKGSVVLRRPETLAAVILSQVVLTSFNEGFHGFGRLPCLNIFFLFVKLIKVPVVVLYEHGLCVWVHVWNVEHLFVLHSLHTFNYCVRHVSRYLLCWTVWLNYQNLLDFLDVCNKLNYITMYPAYPLHR